MSKQSLLSCRPQQHHMMTAGFNNDFFGFSRQDAAKVGVELRWPLFNKKLMELALAIPAWTINRDGQHKSITREAIRPYAPTSMVERGRLGLLGHLAISGAKKRWPHVLEWLNQSDRIWPDYLNEKIISNIS